MEISKSGIKGLGPKKAAALNAAGIHSVQELAGLDLRSFQEPQGISKDNLKALKQRARAFCQQQGIDFEKSPYSRKKGRAKESQARQRFTDGKKRGGVLRRLLGKA